MQPVSPRCASPYRAAGFGPRGSGPAYKQRTSLDGAPLPDGRGSVLLRHGSRSAFTLIEMVVVVAVVLIILGLVLPAASTLWKERKSSEAVNTIQGLLMTTRARAMQADGVETGFFAFLDEEGTQHLVSIERTDPIAQMDPAELAALDQEGINAIRLAHQNVFRITDKPDRVLPAPMRIVPRYVVENKTTNPQAEDFDLFSKEELANNDFATPSPLEWDQVQRHRNFFTMIFSTEGQLLVGRDVLIQDPDEDENGLGDRTRLRVGPGPDCDDSPCTTEYFAQDNDEAPIDPDPGGEESIPFLLIDPAAPSIVDAAALNFPSVDGLLVYDDSLFSELPPAEKRAFLLQEAQPLYVSRWTGTVVRGPVGEPPPTTTP